MLVVLDPGFFREDGIDNADHPTREAAIGRLIARLDDANRLLARHDAGLVVAVDTFIWFDAIYQREARALEAIDHRPLKQGLDRLRQHRRSGRTLPGVPLRGQMWGVPMMADWPGFGRSWRPELERVLAASVVFAAGRGVPVVFLCHRIHGRNAADRSAVGVEFVEVLRWRLSASVAGAPPTRVPCVGRSRHLDVPWTTRLDGRLPDRHGPGLHPYCPPSRWTNSKTAVSGTHQSRPCWLDAQGQWWARPSTGGGYHWDVWLNDAHSQRIGLSQINVTQHGAPPSEGTAGDLHHIPTGKKHAIKSTSGWHCPP